MRISGRDCAQALIDHADVSRWQASRAMGRAGSYIDTVIRKARVPTVDTAAAIADVCGCDLRLVDRATGETVATIEPPARPGAAE